MTRHTRIAVASLLALSTLAGSAQARSMTGFGGRARDPADSNCFSEAYGAHTNNCNTARILEFSLPVDAPGDYWGYVNAYGATSSNNVGCHLFGLNKDASLIWAGPVVYLPVFGTSVDILPARVHVPSFGTLSAGCWVHPGGRVTSVGWSL